MKHRFAFAGFRHPHIFSLWEHVKSHPDCEIVAVFEPDQSTRDDIEASHQITVTHADYDRMLAESGCTIVAIGAVYSERGQLAQAALSAGYHVMADKPLCTRLEEWSEIACISRDSGLSVGCMLDLIETGVIRRLREVIRDGMLGRICTVTIAAQHPLRYGTRASWYFEPNRQGGTINDIGIHVFDLAPWLTARKWDSLLTAREWNAKAVTVPHFKDCAQFHGLLEGGISCFADVSYLAPDKAGYDLPQYWRVTVHGTSGMAEASYTTPELLLVTDQDNAPQWLPPPSEKPRSYLDDFLGEIDGRPATDGLTTERVLRSSRLALEAQFTASASR